MSKSGQNNDKSWSALSLAWELGYTIAVPIVILALLGRFLDKKLGTSPFLLLAGIFLSLIITSIGVAKKTMRIMEQETRNKEQGTNSLVTLGRTGINHKHQITNSK